MIFIILTFMTFAILPLSKEIPYPKETNSDYVNVTSADDKIHAGKYYQPVQMSGQNTSLIDDDFSINYTEAGGNFNLNDKYSFDSGTNEIHVITNHMTSVATKKLSNLEKNSLKDVIITNRFFEPHALCNYPVKATGDAVSYKLSIRNSTNIRICSWSDNSSSEETRHLFNIADTIKKITYS